MSTVRTVIYERTMNGWSAFVPDMQMRLEGRSPDEIDESAKRLHTVLTGLDDQAEQENGGRENCTTLRRIDRPFRVKVFTDKYDWLGPSIVLLSAWYFVAQVVVAWEFRPKYNLFVNPISDLGATGNQQDHYPFVSPRWLLMDISIGALGLAMCIGALVIFTEFRFSQYRRERIMSAVGFALLSIGGIGAVLVACVPENLNKQRFGLHGWGTLMAIGAGQLGILVLGLFLRAIPDWLREFMIIASVAVLLGGISYRFYSSTAFGFGSGALERVVQYPQPLWLMMFGFYISREHWRNGVTGSQFRFAGYRPAEQGAFWWALRPWGRGDRY